MKLASTFRHRNFWLGIAMILTVLFHSGITVSSSALQSVILLCYFGVDICLFASGIGCYFSLDKDADILRFLKRRLQRLGYVYLCFIIPWILWRMRYASFTNTAILGNLLGIQSFISWDSHFNWYIGGLLLYYFLAPYFKKITDSFSTPTKDLLVLVFLVLLGVPFLNSDDQIVFISRLPIFYIGMVYAKLASQGLVLKANSHLLHLLSLLLGFAAVLLFHRYFPDKLWSYGLYWYPYLLVVPGLCVFLSAAADFLNRYTGLRWLYKLISTVGVYSFEVYLLHIPLYESGFGPVTRLFPAMTRNQFVALSIPVLVIACYVLNRLARLLSRISAPKN